MAEFYQSEVPELLQFRSLQVGAWLGAAEKYRHGRFQVGNGPMLSTNIFQGSYVYAPLPPATSYGHRAELWGVVSVHVAFCMGKFPERVPAFQEFLDYRAGRSFSIQANDDCCHEHQDQDKWLKEVRTKVVSVGDDLFVRMEDVETGALLSHRHADALPGTGIPPQPGKNIASP